MGGELEVLDQMIDYRRPETVISDENVAASEYEDGFSEQVVDGAHRAFSQINNA